MPDLWDTFKQGFNTWHQNYTNATRSPQARKEWEMLNERMMQEARTTNPITMGDIPGAGAMVPTAANLPKFMEKARAAYDEARRLGYSKEVAKALAFLGTRYPKRTSLLSEVIENADVGKNLAATTDPASGAVWLGGVKDTPDAVQNIAHELQHITDFARGPKSRVHNWLQGPMNKLYPLWGALSDITQAVTSRTPLKGRHLGTEVYSKWPSEAVAYQAENTTMNSLDKLSELIRQAQQGKP